MFQKALDVIKNRLTELANSYKQLRSKKSPQTDPTHLLVELYKKTKQAGSGKISSSVGKGAANKAEDVVVVKALLVKKGYLQETHIKANATKIGEIDSVTQAAIEKFQQEVRKGVSQWTYAPL